MKKINKLKVVIGAGGTGGHLFPAGEIKEQLEKLGYDVFLITDKRGLRFATNFEKIKIISGGGMSGERLIYRLRSLVKLGFGMIKSLYYLIRINPDVVIGMGGYISVPVIFWGKILSKKTIIHNADSVLGNANFFLTRFADIIAVSFKNTSNIPTEMIGKVRFVGLPIRQEIRKMAQSRVKKLQGKRIISIMGGSQGAKIFGDIVAGAIINLNPKYLKNIIVYHQVVNEDLDKIHNLYKKHNIDFEVSSFFKNSGEILSKTDIFIGRGGASTVSEIGMFGIASIFIPIEHKDQQQVINARQIADNGGAIIIRQRDFSVDRLGLVLSEMLGDNNLLENMSKKAKILKPENNSGKDIAILVGELLNK